MSDKTEHHQVDERQWEQALVDDYYDHRWRQMLEPLCETFQCWKAGEIPHAEVDQAIEAAYKEKLMLHNLFAQRRDRAAGLIQWWDREWFDWWIKEHRLSSNIRLPSLPPLDPDNH